MSTNMENSKVARPMNKITIIQILIPHASKILLRVILNHQDETILEEE